MTGDISRPTVWHIGGDDVHKRIPLLHALKDRGFDVAAVGSEDGAEFHASGVPYFHYNLKRKLTPWSDMHSCRELSALFKKKRPDIVHGFDPKPAIATPILAQRAGIRGRIRTITGLGFVMTSDTLKAKALRPVYRHLQRQASASSVTIFQNNEDRAYFLQNGLVQEGREEIVLSSGVDVEKLRSQRPEPEQLANLRRSLDLDGKLVVTMISRVDANKGVREFVEAADLVRSKIKNTAFVLVGPYESEGKEAAQFVEQIRHRSGTVHYLGPRKDIPAILSLSDLCALPSYREGLPRVLVEAGALEVPSVTTDVPGCRDVVLDDWNGRLVPPRDSQELANAIIELLNDKTKRTDMGKRSYQRAKEKFDLSYVADAYADIYLRALAGGR